MAGLAVGAQVRHLLGALGVVVGDVGDVLPRDAAHGTRAGLGQLGAADRSGAHAPDAIACRARPEEHWLAVPDPYDTFPNLRFDRPADRVLRITLDGPGLNAVDHAMHRELADVWLAVDRDPGVDVALLQGAGKAFSAGGSFELVQTMLDDFEARVRVAREAR
ncbi:MAG: enoyl-CoA hydratase/isomerase family protein, partial [Acidimicrobiia bacterium]|nr:enoyl-CoA hydratase/isomerase family protein [Acidimicrobiia bacterium]